MREEDMSNISDGWADTEDKHKLKCPFCGAEGWVIEYPDDNGCGWFCSNSDCSFSCNPEDLPKMVAAMGMVKTLVLLSECDINPDHYELEKQMEAAERRVLEVFK